MTSVLHAHCRYQFTENRRERGSGVLLGEMETRNVQIQGCASHLFKRKSKLRIVKVEK